MLDIVTEDSIHVEKNRQGVIKARIFKTLNKNIAILLHLKKFTNATFH